MNILNSKTISALAIYLVIIALTTWFVIRPMAQAAQNKVTVLHTQYQAYQLAEQKLTRLTALSKSQADLDHAHDLINRALPPTIDQDRLLITIEKLIANDHLKLVSLVNLPSTTTKTKSSSTDPDSKNAAQNQLAALGSIDITLEATGSYADVKQALDSLEQLDRLITITSVTIKANQSSGQTNSAADATIKLRSYTNGQTL